MRSIWILIGFFSFLLIGTHVALAGPFEKGPVKEPKVKSPLVIKNSKGKVVFEEYFKERTPEYEPYYLGDEVTGFKVFDPATGEVMLDVEMRDGVLSRDIEGTAKDKAREEKIPSSSSVFALYKSYDGTLVFRLDKAGDTVNGYYLIEDVGEENNRLLRTVAVEQGLIRKIREDWYSNDRRIKNLYRNMDGLYVETAYPIEGGYEKRIFKAGYLSEVNIEGTHYAANGFYHNGKLGFWTKQTKENAKKGIFEVYGENDELVDTVKMVFGEYYEIKFEERDGKLVKIFHKTRGKKIVREVIKDMD